MAEPALALLNLMPAPATPRNLGDLTWEEAEAVLGVTLSEQYKMFFSVYGDGSIGGELGFFSYRSGKKGPKFLADLTELLPNDISPFPMYPDGDRSLLPLGYDGDGYVVYCVVEQGRMAEEEYWMGNRRFGDWIRIPGPFFEFLYRLLTDYGSYFDLEPGAPSLDSHFVSVT